MVSFFHRESEQGNIWFEPFLLCKAPPSYGPPPPPPGRHRPGPHALIAQDIWMPKIVSMRVLSRVQVTRLEISFVGGKI